MTNLNPYLIKYTKLRDILDVQKLYDAVDDGWVRRQTHPSYPELVVYNYTEKTAWEKMWTTETLESRGLIVCSGHDPVVLARPYKKFFNHDEMLELPPIDGLAEVTDKMDGSLGIGYLYDGKWAVATRGSFASDQAKWATAWLYRVYLETFSLFGAPDGWTPLWEIVFPSNRIVLDYRGYEGLVLLGWRRISDGKVEGPMAFPDHWRGDRTELMESTSLLDALRLEPRKNAEGVVVRWLHNDHQVKIKQEDYKRMHAVVTNTTNRSLWKLGPDAELPDGMPDEFATWAKVTLSGMKHKAYALSDKIEQEFTYIFRVLNGDHTRAQFAQLAKKSPNSAALFQKYDGKDVFPWCWKQIEPETIERPFGEQS